MKNTQSFELFQVSINVKDLKTMSFSTKPTTSHSYVLTGNMKTDFNDTILIKLK